MTIANFEQSIAALDISIFKIQSETTYDDRRSFLAVQNAVREVRREYIYLECGSHIGGSLLPHVLDPRCRIVYSVDKRPSSQLDERGYSYPYPGNSSQRMMATLAREASPESLQKVLTFDMDASELTADQIHEKPDLVMIDAEHTNTAVFSDFLNIYRHCHPATVYAFHDANLIFPGLQNIEAFLRYSGVAFDSYVLPSVVYVLAPNEARAMMQSVGATFGLGKQEFELKARNYIISHHYDLVRTHLANQAKQGA
jgi:hypothetical protein